MKPLFFGFIFYFLFFGRVYLLRAEFSLTQNPIEITVRMNSNQNSNMNEDVSGKRPGFLPGPAFV